MLINSSNLPSDPLFNNPNPYNPHQWYLNNQHGGDDLNVVDVWNDYTGEGVLVGVIDDGFDYNHPDLNDNYNRNIDYDYNDNDYYPYGTNTNSHGTNVAGIIAAEKNGIGGVGVAYDAEITGYRAISVSLYSSEMITATTNSINHAVNKGVDVINNSWGFSPASPQTEPIYNGFYDNFYNSAFSNAKNAIENAVENGRNGLGTAIVFAAGNHRTVGENTNYHNYQNSRHVITVGALNADGNVSSYSTPGASILVSGFGSEGDIVTTDRQGSAGSTSGDYNNGFNGTSAAAPMVSGIIALMLEANPYLGYRDIQEILAYSARQTGSNANNHFKFNEANNWNGGGLHVSHDAGFGLVDAHAAVRLAETWQSQSTSHNEKSESKFQTVGQWIPDGYSQITSTINMPSGIDIDFVEVDLNIDHYWRGDLEVTLTSPNGTGTTSKLIDKPGLAGDNRDNIKFKVSSTHHWGETSGGDWTLTVKDLYSRNTWNTGGLNDWTLTLYGDTDTNNDTYIYTNEFSNVYNADNSRQTLSDNNGGTDTINASAITSNTTLNLNSGAYSTLDYKSLRIHSTTVIENAFTGDGDDTITGNSASNELNAGRGNDILTGYADGSEYDTLTGGSGEDTFVLGNALDVFYKGWGYGTITDFNRFDDEIQLKGSSNLYSLISGNWLGSSAQDTVIRYNGDWIGMVQDTSNLSLTASYFDYESGFAFV